MFYQDWCTSLSLTEQRGSSGVVQKRLSHATEGAKLRSLAYHKHLEIMVTRRAEGDLSEIGVFRSDLPVILRDSCIIHSER
jgi:hypothetical protein